MYNREKDIADSKELSKKPIYTRIPLILYYNMRLIVMDFIMGIVHLFHRDQRKAMFKRIIKFSTLVYKKATGEAIFKEASSLTYITILGFIPFFAFIVFLVPHIPTLSKNVDSQGAMFKNLLPASAGEVGTTLSSLIAKKAGFNAFTFLLAVITSYSLFNTIRKTFDRILVNEFRPPQDIVTQLVQFFGMIILGFVITLAIFSSSSFPIISSVVKFAFLQQVLVYVVPFIMQFIGLVFLYLLLPSLKIKRSSVIRGAFWTSIIATIVKGFFDYYIYHLTNFQQVFGVLKSIPIMLIWIYFNWVIVLAGMVLVSIMEYREKALDEEQHPKYFVRMNFELYTDKKLDRNVNAIISKKEMQTLVDHLTENDES